MTITGSVLMRTNMHIIGESIATESSAFVQNLGIILLLYTAYRYPFSYY